MKNRILSVSFNAAHFPVSPRTDATIIELDHHVLYVPLGLEPPSSDFSMAIDPQREEAYVICLPHIQDHDVRLEARIISTDIFVGFDVINNAEGNAEYTIPINAGGYFKELGKFLKKREPLDLEEELAIKVGSMKALFREAISGNDAFWYRFQNDFANVMAPVRKDPSLTNDDYLALKTVVPMPARSVNRAMCLNTPNALQ